MITGFTKSLSEIYSHQNQSEKKNPKLTSVWLSTQVRFTVISITSLF